MKKSVLLPTNENLLITIKEDALERNADLNSFCQLLSHQDSINSIALDGRWGSGKTFFVKQCALLINAKNSLSNIDKRIAQSILEVAKQSNSFEGLTDNKLLAVYFDAWENDSEEDPVLSLIYRIVQQLDLKTSGFDLQNLAHVLGTIADAITDRPISNVISSLKECDFLDVIRKHEDLETTIKAFFEEILFEKSERLVIFVDELDRCRPSYAVRLLECIEHYFINDRITFVFSVNLEQLQHTIKNFYGNDFDACRYLDRFFDLRISLPQVNMEKYYYSLNLFDNWIVDVLKNIQKNFNLSLRELCKINDVVYEVCLKNSYTGIQDFMFKYIVTLCLALKITDISLHNDFINGKNDQPLLDLYDNEFGDSICEMLLNNGEELEDLISINGARLGSDGKVTREEKLEELYEAIFIKNYTSYDYVTKLGEFGFTEDSRKFILDIESLLRL